MRLAKRLPDKTSNFYKELSKFRRTAFSLGFYEALDAVAVMLERELELQCATQTVTAEAHVQLTHAINSLRSREITERDLEADIHPLKMQA